MSNLFSLEDNSILHPSSLFSIRLFHISDKELLQKFLGSESQTAASSSSSETPTDQFELDESEAESSNSGRLAT